MSSVFTGPSSTKDGCDVMEALKFANNTHERGFNLTVRLGNKWSRLMPGESILLTDTSGHNPIAATVEEIRVLKLKNLLSEDLAYEHDPRCRNLEGLYWILRQVYDADDINEDAIVTLVLYWQMN